MKTLRFGFGTLAGACCWYWLWEAIRVDFFGGPLPLVTLLAMCVWAVLRFTKLFGAFADGGFAELRSHIGSWPLLTGVAFGLPISYFVDLTRIVQSHVT